PRRPPCSTLFPYTTLFRSFDDVAERGQMREQIEMLKDCADPPAKFIHAPPVLAPGKRRLELDIRTLDRPTVDSLQTIQATQQSRDRKSTRLNSSHLGISYA